MPKTPKFTIVGDEGHSGYPSTGSKPIVSITEAVREDDVTKAYRVVNQMVSDGVIKEYALGGAMGAFFYIEPSFTSDVDMFCLLAHEPRSSGIVMLTPIIDYLKAKGYEDTPLGAVIEGIEIQFQFPADSLGEASIEHATIHDVKGVPVRVMTPEYLVAHMLKTNRGKDRIRLLRFIEIGGFNPTLLYEILVKHGMEDKYLILERLERESV